MNAILDIWVDDMRAAEIHASAQNGFSLKYTSAWLQYEKNYPFSPHLPLDQQLSGAEVKNFFENLLPEGTTLDAAASMHHLNKHDAFGLLAKIGREVAGAMHIIPHLAPYETEISLRPLSLTEISIRIQERPQRPFSVWDQKMRLSIAGFQDKLAVVIDNEKKFYLPNGSASSTHIIKPENINTQFPFMPANEYFCMRLAHKLGLSVPDVQLLHIPQALYVVTRYDRTKEEENQIKRLHQIDLCQTLNLSVEMKYQQGYQYAPEGATYVDLFNVISLTTYPARNQLEVIRWIVFNYMIGNTDAHAKNISFFLDHQGLRLAPFYDLVSGTIYGLKDMALFIGDEEEINLVSANDWIKLCQSISGLNPLILGMELLTQAVNWGKIKSTLLEENAYQADEKEFLIKLSANIDERVALMTQHASDVLRLKY